MAVAFTWSVADMHKITSTGAVYKVEWHCSGIDADTKVSHSRSGSYLHTDSDGKQDTPDHTASSFTPYADLTKADVLVWCKADGVGASNEALITSNITNKIATQATSNGMPWATE